MSERKLTDAYWIEVGVQRERMRINELLHNHVCSSCTEQYKVHKEEGFLGDSPDPYPRSCLSFMEHVELLKATALKELQRLAEETGEHEDFDNPLIDRDKA